MSSQVFRVNGRNPPNVDAADKVTGRAIFRADVKLPGILMGKVLFTGARPYAICKAVVDKVLESERAQ